MKTLKFKVLQKDIDAARSDGGMCPIEFAIHRRREPYSVCVLRSRAIICDIFYNNNFGDITLILPKRAQNFIRRFDTNKEVKPFEFTAKVYAKKT